MRTAFLLSALPAAAGEDVVGWGDVKDTYESCRDDELAQRRRLYDLGNTDMSGDPTTSGTNDAFERLLGCIMSEYGENANYQGDLEAYLLTLIQAETVGWDDVAEMFEDRCLPEEPMAEDAALQFVVSCIEGIYPTGTKYQANLESYLKELVADETSNWDQVRKEFADCQEDMENRRRLQYADKGMNNADFNSLKQCIVEELGTIYQGDLVGYLQQLIAESSAQDDEETNWDEVQKYFEAECLPKMARPIGQQQAVQQAFNCVTQHFGADANYQDDLKDYLEDLVDEIAIDWNEVQDAFDDCMDAEPARRLQYGGTANSEGVMGNTLFKEIYSCVLSAFQNDKIFQANLEQYVLKLIGDDEVDWGDVSDEFSECLGEVERPSVKSQAAFNSLLGCVKRQYPTGTNFQGDLEKYFEGLYKAVEVNDWDSVKEVYEECKDDMASRRLQYGKQGQNSNGSPMLQCVVDKFKSPFYQGNLAEYLAKLRVINWGDVKAVYDEHCQPREPVDANQALSDAKRCIEEYFGAGTKYQGDLNNYIKNELLPETVNWGQVKAIYDECRQPKVRMLYMDKQSAVVRDDSFFEELMKCVVEGAKVQHESIVFQGDLKAYLRGLMQTVLLVEVDQVASECAKENLRSGVDINTALQVIRKCVDEKMRAKYGSNIKYERNTDIVKYLKEIATKENVIVGEEEAQTAYEACNGQMLKRRLARAPRVDDHVARIEKCIIETLTTKDRPLLIFDLGQAFRDWVRNKCANDKPVVGEAEVKKLFLECLSKERMVTRNDNTVNDLISCVQKKVPTNAKVTVNVVELVRKLLDDMGTISRKTVEEIFRKHCSMSAVRKLEMVPGVAAPNPKIDGAMKCVVEHVEKSGMYPIFAEDLRQILAELLQEAKVISLEEVEVAFEKCFADSARVKARKLMEARPSALEQEMVKCVLHTFGGGAKYAPDADVQKVVRALLNSLYAEVKGQVEKAFKGCAHTTAEARRLMAAPSTPFVKVVKCVMSKVPNASRFPAVQQLLKELWDIHTNERTPTEEDAVAWSVILPVVKECHANPTTTPTAIRRLQESIAERRTNVQVMKLKACVMRKLGTTTVYPNDFVELLRQFIEDNALKVEDDEELNEQIGHCGDVVLGASTRKLRSRGRWGGRNAKRNAERQAERDRQKALRKAKNVQKKALKQMDKVEKTRVKTKVKAIEQCVTSRYPPNADWGRIRLDKKIKKRHVVSKYNNPSYRECLELNEDIKPSYHDPDNAKHEEYFNAMHDCVEDSFGDYMFYGHLPFYLTKRIHKGWFSVPEMPQ